jgi:hypothetical protein
VREYSTQKEDKHYTDKYIVFSSYMLLISWTRELQNIIRNERITGESDFPANVTAVRTATLAYVCYLSLEKQTTLSSA